MKCCTHCQDYRNCDENLGACCKYCFNYHEDGCTHKKAKQTSAKLGG